MSGHSAAHDMANAPLDMVDPGASGTISIDRYGAIVEMVSAGVETRTLNNPTRSGVRATVRLKTAGGNVTVSAANGLNVAGNTAAVFGDVGDQLDMVSVSHTTGYRWEILTNTGSVGLS